MTDLKVEEATVREQLEAGEQRLLELKRLLDVERLKEREEEAEVAVAEARAAEVRKWSYDIIFNIYHAYVVSPGLCDCSQRSSKQVLVLVWMRPYVSAQSWRQKLRGSLQSSLKPSEELARRRPECKPFKMLTSSPRE